MCDLFRRLVNTNYTVTLTDDKKTLIRQIKSSASEAYKWEITPTDQEGVYKISLFDDAASGYLHLTDYKIQSNNSLSTGPYDPGQDNGYKFYIREATQ